ncbi:VOC family protein [Paenibacillus sp. 2RAB27]|uniref:VOC family protein n=1 Tax=Paenibacillus sp. 2RAB27 TaxID=3232991 RepID=UPI003F9473FC
MKIAHIAMYVKDLELNKQFFIKFFNAKSNAMYVNAQTGLKTYFLTFDEGADLEIMSRPNMTDGSKELTRAGFSHMAFSVGSKEKVDLLTRQLADAGYDILSGPRTTGDGYYESCVLGPENNQIEITV